VARLNRRELLALLTNQQLRMTDILDEQDVTDLEFQFARRIGGM
jgi:hypothetical protein